jgi:predicted metal-dependent HD superfamily phosphohydrolase
MVKGQPGQYGIEALISAALFHPDYRKTLANLRENGTKVELRGSALHFTEYAFEPASVFPTGLVTPEQISDINLYDDFPQVRLKAGEVLFIRPVHKEALLMFANRHDVPVQRRVSVWSAVLDPFLDTWEEQAHIDRQFEWFASLGLDREAVTRWRSEVAIAMVAYNFGAHVWEWVRLDLHDVLIAQRACLNRSAFAEFYARAMALAAIDPVSAYWGWNPTKSVDGALHSVLLDWHPRNEISAPRSSSPRKSTGGAPFGGLLRWFRRENSLALESTESRKERHEQIRVRQKMLLADLTAEYSQPHRRYHTLTHIEHCLGELSSIWDCPVHLEEVRWALIFHDAVYDPRRDDNEIRSADWACRIMEDLGRPEDERARVRGLILATAHMREPNTADEALLHDIDLSILGADEATFDQYEHSIRDEYEFIPEPHYREARAELLTSFLRRDRIFHTALYRRRLETCARDNLKRALARLHTE